MRMLLHFQFPIEPFNSAVRDGTVGAKLEQIVEAIRPEAIWFTEHNGCRGGTAVVNLEDSSQVPAVAEPLFLTFGAKMELRIAMTPEELARADLGRFAQFGL